VPLRLKDRSQFGREINCPDCGKRLRIVADAGEVRAVRVEEPIVGLELPRRPGSKGTLRLIWLATACLGVVIVWIASRPGTPETQIERTRFEEAPPATVAAVSEPLVEQSKVEPPPETTPPAAEPPRLPEPLPAEAPQVAAVADRPIVPDFAPDVPAVDVATQLSLRIEEYSQTRPVPVRLLLRQIAELSAVPVDLSEVEIDPWRAKLDKPVTVELRQTTVGKVLDEILRQSELSYRHRDGVIFVAPPRM
jgi:hypothetical protein